MTCAIRKSMELTQLYSPIMTWTETISIGFTLFFGLVYQVHLIGVGFNGFGVCLPIPGEIIQSLTVAYYVFTCFSLGLKTTTYTPKMAIS